MEGYEGVLLVDLLLGSFDGDDVLEGDDFGGTFVGPALFEGEEVAVGEDHPASDRCMRTASSS